MPNPFLIKGLRFVFMGVQKIWPEKNLPFQPDQINRILLVCTTAIGDTLMSTPAIRAIRKTFPRAFIAVLASPPAREILQNNPNLDEILAHSGRVNTPFFISLPRLLGKILSRKFDLVVILHANDPEAVPLAYLSGAPHRVGWKESRLSFLLNHPVETYNNSLHVVDLRLKIAGEAGVKPDGRNLEIFLLPEEEKKISDLFSRMGLLRGPFIGIHPFGSITRRWWPAHYVRSLGERLHKTCGIQLILVGSRGEVKISESIVRDSFMVSFVGKCSIRETAALIKKCEVFISTDSGPMHLAQALHVPTIALCGPGSPRLIGPVQPNSLVLYKGRDCTGCVSSPCPKPSCMEEISVEEVMDAISKITKKDSMAPTP